MLILSKIVCRTLEGKIQIILDPISLTYLKLLLRLLLLFTLK